MVYAMKTFFFNIYVTYESLILSPIAFITFMVLQIFDPSGIYFGGIYEEWIQF